ncbi:MAG: hypothetical protein U1E76_18350 [Planctomycetota bacterium]
MRTYSRAVLMFWLFAAPALAGGNQGNSALEGHRLVAFNDLGMHCMDREFSVFAILPPFNVVNAQVIRQGVHGNPVILDSSAVELRYLPVADRTGSINSTSRLKTDFWQYAYELFGATLRPGQGLLGFYMPKDRPTTVPQLMNYHASYRWFSAEGVPITPIDDAGQVNTYPLMRIAAFDRLTGTELAQLDVVVPVAQETDCKNCHATGEIAARDPAIGWSNDPDIEIQSKENVLILHDWNQWTNLRGSTPVLCASCHYSPALDLAGAGPQGDQVGRPLMSHVAHNFHGKLRDDAGQPLFPPDGDAEQTCYQCPPGKVTKCERGAMKNGNLECKDCHGGMLSVGAEHLLLPGGSMDGQNDGGRRRPWLDLPRCQSCHTGDVLSHLSGRSTCLRPMASGCARRSWSATTRRRRFSPPTSASPRISIPGTASASAMVASPARAATTARMPSGPMPIRSRTTTSPPCSCSATPARSSSAPCVICAAALASA